MKLRDLVTALGGDRDLAAALGLRPVSIRMWLYNGYVPPKHHARIIAMASAHGLAVTAEDLDPNRTRAA